MGWFQREIMRNHWLLDVLPWRHVQINILKVSTVGGDHPKTSPGVEYWCNIMLPESWQHFCWIFVFQLGGVFGVSYDSYDGEPSSHQSWGMLWLHMSEAQTWFRLSSFGCWFQPSKFFGVYTRPEKFKWFTGENAEVCWTVRFSWDQFLCNLRFHAAQGELASQ